MLKFRHGFFYGISIVVFILDVCCFSFFEQHYLQPLLCLYIVTATRSHISYMRICFLSALLLLEYFLYYGSVVPFICLLIPLTLLCLLARKFLYAPGWSRYGLLLVALTANYFIIEPYFYGVFPGIAYTCYALFANVIIMMLFP